MGPRRIVATLGVAVSATVMLAGCKAGDALSTQEVVVHFAPGTTRAQHVEVQQACAGLPHTSPEPIPSAEVTGQDVTDVRFLVNPGVGKTSTAGLTCSGRPASPGGGWA